MRTWPDADGGAINRHLQQLRPRNPITPKVYRCVLSGFQRFVVQRHCGPLLSQQTIEAWLRERATQWPMHLVLHRARIVDRFLDFLVTEGSIPSNPLAQLRSRYAQRMSIPIVRALLAPAPEEALEALRPLPRFASFLGGLMYDHIKLM
jgi:integrase/recombinase XerD